jgi:NMT1-like family protein
MPLRANRITVATSCVRELLGLAPKISGYGRLLAGQDGRRSEGQEDRAEQGSNVHYLLVRALEKAGLKYTDVEVVYLPPADGREAFEKGAIDAWVIWEPYRTAAEMSSGARTLADGSGRLQPRVLLRIQVVC